MSSYASAAMEVGLLRQRLPLRAGSRTHVHARARLRRGGRHGQLGSGWGFFGRPVVGIVVVVYRRTYVGLPAVAVASRGRAVYMNGVNYDGVGRLEPRLKFWRSWSPQ